MTDKQPIILSTFADLAAGGYTIAVDCLNCGRHVELDPASLPAGEPYIRRAFRCGCGALGAVTVTKPNYVMAR